MSDSFLGDATGMGENLEAVTAGDGDQRDAGGFGGADSKCGGRRYGDDDWNADDSGVLYQLPRKAAGQRVQAAAANHMVARERAADLVERVVTPDVRAQGDKAARGLPECRAMHRTGFAVQRLGRADRFHGPHDVARRKPLTVGNNRRRPARLAEGLDAAKPASRRSGKSPAPLAEGRTLRLPQPQSQFDPDFALDNVELLDVVE